MNNREKFNRWIVQPLEALRSVPEGGGSFVAILAGMALLNGLVKGRYLKDHEGQPQVPEIQFPADELIDEFLGIDPPDWRKVHSWRKALSGVGWGMFMIPKKTLRIDASYGAIPLQADDGRWEVDPWKFVDLVLAKADENMDLIDEGYFPLMRAYIEEDE